MPSPGVIENLKLPENSITGPVRIDTHISTGFKVSPFYDSMLAKVIAHGQTRKEALEIMKKALGEIKIEGVKTTIDFHQAILNQKDFVSGLYDCSFIAKNLKGLIWPN
jgi:acetyl-CoA carboxylase biotin carboxylase subunit